MSQPTPLDITNMPDLVRIAEEVKATNKPRVLKRDNTPLAILTPVKKKQSAQAKRKAIKETLALAGTWSDLDFEKMLDALDHIRHDSKPTPPFELDL
jgi:ribosome assembly protein YihI (activator of Der GTPase)